MFMPTLKILFSAVILIGIVLLLAITQSEDQDMLIKEAKDYPIQGFDISHHQGHVNWDKIPLHEYQFVFLKATQGQSFKDPRFREHWKNARAHGLRVGAYHFYDLCQDGRSQAQHFIATVPKTLDALPPVIDLEYDSNCINTYTQEQLLHEIQIMHDALSQHYQKSPIFYTSKAFYHIVLTGHFPKTPLWIRDYQGTPLLKDGRAWLFWQYTQTGQIHGIDGAVDRNVFSGHALDWYHFVHQPLQPAHAKNYSY